MINFFLYLSFAGPDSFYVTNDNFFHFESTVMRNLWAFLLNYWLPCNIVFFDGFKAIKAFVGVHPNGIAMDKDERLVRVSIKCHSKWPTERRKAYYDTCHLCTLFRIDGMKAISGGNFRGIQVIRVANRSHRGLVCLFSQNGGGQNTDPQCMDYSRLKWTAYAAEV